MKPTLFVAGLFPHRNQELLRQLCQRFRVIMLRGHVFEVAGSPGPEIADDLLADDEDPANHRKLCWEIIELVRAQEADLDAIFNESGAGRIDLEDYEDIYDFVIPIYFLGETFSRIADRFAIDLVLCNAEYQAFRRPILLEARRRGIPVLNIEHGFFAAAPGSAALKSPNEPQGLPFVADFVNLDNHLEVEYWRDYYEAAGLPEAVQFIVNGTPNDRTYNPEITRREARATLGIAEDKFTILIASTWIEPQLPSNLIRAQIEHGEFIKKTIACCAELSREQDLQVVVKMHPAFGQKEVWADTAAFIQNYARSLDFNLALVTLSRPTEVISATDLLICPQASSMLWECFLGDRPGIVYPLPSVYFDSYEKNKLNSSNPLYERGCLHFVFDEEELKARISHYLAPQNYQDFQRRAAALKAEKHIKVQSVEEKAANLCDWISNYVENRKATSQ